MLERLRPYLNRKVLIVGLGNRLRSADGAGSILAGRLRGKNIYSVFDVETAFENYLGKLIKEDPESIIIIDAADFGGSPGEFKAIGADKLETAGFYSTHDASLSMSINYLQTHIAADIIILAIQPKITVFGEKLSREVAKTLDILENWFYEQAKEKR